MQLDKEKLKRQIQLEEEQVEIGVRKYREQLLKSTPADMPPGIALLNRCLTPFCKAIEEFKLPRRGGAKLGHIRTFFRLFETEELAFIAAKRIIESISIVEPVQRTAIGIADRLIQHLEYKKFKQQNPAYLNIVERNLKTSNQRHKRVVILYAKRKIGIEDTSWSSQDKLHMGIKLIDLFIESTGLVQRVQESSKRGKQGRLLLQASDEVLAWLEKQHARCELLDPMYLPMIVPPKDWTNPYDGGYYTLPLTFVKTRNKEALKDLENHPMPLEYAAVNALQRTPWRINKNIYKVMKEVWDAGESLGDLPQQTEEPLPTAPWSSDEEFQWLKENHPEVVKEWKHSAAKVYERRISERSKRIALATKLWIAEKFLSEPEIYFCWTLDWRGRKYPVQSYINPQGDDSGRALIEFAEGKPLGERGVFWLKIHLANCFGVDKVSFEERVKWVDDHKLAILDSAYNPLDGNRLWCNADSPYTFLAACLEFAGYCKEGVTYKSHLPISLDGSCNGLQNFSAMLRDEVGGRAVNLIPQDKPNDIYQRVAEVLSKQVEEDALNGDEDAQVWVGKIDRGITKRGVMTFVYGAKKYGMKDQLLDELVKRDKPSATYLEVEDNFKPCSYLANRLYESIGSVVIAAKAAMDWLQEVARICSKSDQAIVWTTPSGFRPRQEYFKQLFIRVSTFWGNTRIRLGLNEDLPQLDRRKQAAGIAPNFVHSMDSSHLTLTINKCLEEGIHNFCMIHDSYGTHACDTDKLSEILREMFIKQYSIDVLEAFRQEIINQLPSEELKQQIPELPPKGNLDLSLVRESKYFFA